MMDFAQFVEQIKSTVDIRTVVSEYVPLKRSGSRWVGRCPFHTEKSASFGVTEHLRIFKCFGCGKGGSVIDFVMEIEGATFWEACKSLAERFGIPLPKRGDGFDASSKKRAGIFDAHEIAQRLFRAALGGPGGSEAREYLKRRGLSSELAEQFGIGFADRSGQMLLKKLQQEGFAGDQMLDTGLVGQRDGGGGFYDRFRGRIMFPIQNEQGKIIAYGGRAMSDEDQPKYLNSPETDLYRKSQVLYNLNRARKPIRDTQHAVLVEGYMDVIGLASGGVGEAVATCGTALVNTQVQILRRHTDNIVVNFDSDNAGVNAAERSVQILLAEGMHIRVLELPGSKDPDEFVKEHGADAYRKLLAEAPRYFHWLRERARKRFDVRSAEGKVEAARYLLRSVRLLHDKFERAAVAAELAHDLGIDRQLLLEQVRTGPAPATAASLRPKVDLPPNERLLLSGLLHDAEARLEAIPRLHAFLARKEAEALQSFKLLKTFIDVAPEYSFEAWHSRLGEQERTLLTSLAFADESKKASSETEAVPIGPQSAQVLGCIDRLEAGFAESALSRLKQQIAEAQKSGDVAEALRLGDQLRSIGDHRRGRERTQ